MPVVICEHCQRRVNVRLRACPRCGAPRLRDYEWRTAGEWMGLPLVHVAFGLDEKGQPRHAVGVIAIGQKATGWLAIGIIARGFVAIGLIALGCFSVGILSLGFVAALGMNAFGYMALGAVAVGAKATGFATWGG